MRIFGISLSIALCLVVSVNGQTSKDVAARGFILPPGFSIAEVAGPELANDIYCITFSPQGHLVVSGRGYVKQLIDEQGDGIFDRAVLLADHPKDGSMGMLIETDQFYVMGDGGLRRMPWNAGKFTEKSELLLRLKTGGEHDAHAISRGPDGWLYLLCGNTAGVTDQHATLPSSPIRKHTAGCVLRISPNLADREILCDGFRNAYGFDWSLEGELYTYDSDNERCLGLPWYEGCRFYRVARGGHYGWRSPQLAQFWRHPPYYAEVESPVLDLGRGSPTGVVCNRHQQFPKEYEGSFFLLDWTFGVIHCVELSNSKATSRSFLKVEPGHGFAPSSAAFHPVTGDLYVASGGRGTRGAIYRIRHEAGFASLPRAAFMQKPRLNPESVTLRVQPAPVKENREVLLKKLKSSDNAKEQLRLICLIHRELGTIGSLTSEYAFKEGYSFKNFAQQTESEAYTKSLKERVHELFPSSDLELNRELSRTMALLLDDNPSTLSKLLKQITPTSAPIDDIHYLFVLACCRGKRTAEQTQATAQALLQLDRKYETAKLQRERNWSLRLSEAVKALYLQDPLLPPAVLKHAELGRPDHLLLAGGDASVRQQFALHWLVKVQAEPDYPWTTELVQILSHNDSRETLKLFRKKWVEVQLQEAILPTLIKARELEDRSRIVSGLNSLNVKTVKLCMGTLESLPVPTGADLYDELAACLRGLRYWDAVDKKQTPLFIKRLQTLAQSSEKRTSAEWQLWYFSKYPELKSKLEASDGVDRSKWDTRLARIDWKKGRTSQGEVLYKQHCAACHQGTSALGPDLAGIGKRFSNEDLITAVIQPSKDVPARYRTAIYTTHSGQTYSGLVIYEAVDGIILQTASSGAIRIAGNDIAGSRTSDRSLMPAGLLDGFSDQQVADLLAWLKR